ncbi:hypothetical protein Dsin_006275 [Dipteronia sinensis]|uniref:Cation/H+ exchanger transmembrane domain-containing protein n=1 Tax=Dipteronia sinensis TaxID=43782 RepID=A0AAE0AYY5_9ROSI|nr:hypothetical protein Dsin_006275 [Dipteronia sinensis]
MSLNITPVKNLSYGAWQGDNPLKFAFPLLIIQITLVLFTSRFLAFLIKPLHQPKVIAEIVGGILLGPSALSLGRNEDFLRIIFPSWGTPILESVASIGLLFFLFLVGLELHLRAIRRNGKSAFIIAPAGITLPFLFSTGVSLFLQKAIHVEKKPDNGQFIGESLSIRAFPVLARILADLKLLTTQVGQTAMAAAAFNDVAAWILLALAVAIAGNGTGEEPHKSSLISIWVLLSGISFVVFMFIVIRHVKKWVAHQCSSEQDSVEGYICMTLVGVMISGFLTDLIGIHAIFGAFVFGLTSGGNLGRPGPDWETGRAGPGRQMAEGGRPGSKAPGGPGRAKPARKPGRAARLGSAQIDTTRLNDTSIPKDGEFAERLMKRIQDFVSGLLLPLYFASSGLKTDVSKIRGAEAWGLLVLVISTACGGKILGTFVMAIMCTIPARESPPSMVKLTIQQWHRLTLKVVGSGRSDDAEFTRAIGFVRFATDYRRSTMKVRRRFGFDFVSLSTQLENENRYFGYNGWHMTDILPVVLSINSPVISSAVELELHQWRF